MSRRGGHSEKLNTVSESALGRVIAKVDVFHDVNVVLPPFILGREKISKLRGIDLKGPHSKADA